MTSVRTTQTSLFPFLIFTNLVPQSDHRWLYFMSRLFVLLSNDESLDEVFDVQNCNLLYLLSFLNLLFGVLFCSETFMSHVFWSDERIFNDMGEAEDMGKKF